MAAADIGLLTGAARELLDLLQGWRRIHGHPTGREIAVRAGIAPSYVSEIFNGRKVPSPDVAADLVQAIHPDQHRQMAARRLAERAETDRASAKRPEPWSRIRSGYIEQVRDIAPAELIGRDAELAELAAFCAGAEPISWWRAGPWAGKTALLATFVLRPPSDVEVVSFFVTARLATQADSTAFTDALLDQLSAIVGESPPTGLTPVGRDAHRRALLQAATRKLTGERRRLVLVVDGLDEDCGTHPTQRLASIASLLPKDPGAGLRIIVASRPHPDIPADVPGDHPLRHCRVRQLTTSPHAAAIADRAHSELAGLLHSPDPHRDLIGLIAAAGGGLTLADLEHLTGAAPYHLRDLLDGVCGRTITARGERPDAGPIQVYLFAHETLHAEAASALGASLTAYCARIHSWADTYRGRRWPSDTPPYLLRGYPRMLQTQRDLTRLTALVTDPDRQCRLFETTSGDAAALTEIAAAQDLVVSRPVPDLATMARLAVHRDDLAARNGNIPTGLPAAWAAVGHFDRAEILSRAITRRHRRIQAMTAAAEAMVAAGQLDRGEALARSITDPYWQVRALAGLAEAMTRAGHAERGATLANTINHPAIQVDASVGLARSVAAAGEFDRGEALARTITDVTQRDLALVGVVEALAAARHLDRGIDLANGITASHRQAEALAILARAAAAAGHPDRGEALVHRITQPDRRTRALGDLASEMVAAGHLDRGEAIARGIDNRTWQDHASTGVAAAMIAAGHLDRGEALARGITDPIRKARVARALVEGGHVNRAEDLVRTIDNPHEQAQALAGLARALAVAGHLDRAEALAAQIEAGARTDTDPDRNPRESAALVEALAATGHIDHGEALAHTLTNTAWRAEALTALVQALAAAGQVDRGEALATTITDPNYRAQALTALVQALAVTGQTDRGEALARTITKARWRAEATTHLAREMALAGNPDRGEALACTVSDPNQRADALAAVAIAVALIGQHERAEALLRTINSPQDRPHDVVALVAVMAANRRIDHAEALARSVAHAYWQVGALAVVVEALAATSDLDRARSIAADAGALAKTISDAEQRAEAMTALVRAAADAIELPHAEAAARAISDPVRQIQALSAIVEAVGVNGPRDRAVALVAEAEAVLGHIKKADERVQALTAIMRAMAATGHVDRALTLATTAEAATSGIRNVERRGQALIDIVDALAAGSDRESALVAATEALATARTAHTDRTAKHRPADGDASRSPIVARWLASHLRVAGWQTSLGALTRVSTAAVAATAEEYMRRARTVAGKEMPHGHRQL
jgi:hypothetical protein